MREFKTRILLFDKKYNCTVTNNKPNDITIKDLSIENQRVFCKLILTKTVTVIKKSVATVIGLILGKRNEMIFGDDRNMESKIPILIPSNPAGLKINEPKFASKRRASLKNGDITMRITARASNCFRFKKKKIIGPRI